MQLNGGPRTTLCIPIYVYQRDTVFDRWLESLDGWRLVLHWSDSHAAWICSNSPNYYQSDEVFFIWILWLCCSHMYHSGCAFEQTLLRHGIVSAHAERAEIAVSIEAVNKQGGRLGLAFSPVRRQLFDWGSASNEQFPFGTREREPTDLHRRLRISFTLRAVSAELRRKQLTTPARKVVSENSSLHFDPIVHACSSLRKSRKCNRFLAETARPTSNAHIGHSFTLARGNPDLLENASVPSADHATIHSIDFNQCHLKSPPLCFAGDTNQTDFAIFVWRCGNRSNSRIHRLSAECLPPEVLIIRCGRCPSESKKTRTTHLSKVCFYFIALR